MIVNLHIDRLVLDGLPLGSHEGPLVQAAVEAELRRALSVDGFPGGAPHSFEAAYVRTPPIEAAAGARQLGGAVAQAILGEIR